MANTINSKIRIKRSTVTGATPTIGPSIDYTDGTWGVDDIYTGELFYNVADERLWIGSTTGVTEVKLSERKSVELEIGDWDMDASATLNVAQGLSATEWKTVRGISTIIRNDADGSYQDFGTYLDATSGGNTTSINSTNITLTRATGGLFDNTLFDSTSYNRGWITFSYVVD